MPTGCWISPCNTPNSNRNYLFNSVALVRNLSTFNLQLSTNLHCSILLIHGDQDEIFPITYTKHLVSLLQTNGVPVELKIIPGLPHGMEPERGVIFRSIGEYCLTLAGKNVWQN